MRRNRPVVAAAAATVLMATIGLTAVLVVQSQANSRLIKANDDLTAALAREEKAKSALETTNDALNVALIREEKANEGERQRFDLAMEAIQAFHTGVSEDFLMKQDTFKELRMKLLGGPREFYGKLQALLKDQTDRRSRKALGRAYFQLGGLTSQIGSKPEALAVHRQALELRKGLAEQRGDDEATSSLAFSHNSIGLLLWALGKPIDALASYESARSIYQKLADVNPAVADFQDRLAATHTRIGLRLAALGKLTEALSSYETARAIQQKIVDANPTVTAYQSHLGDSHDVIGVVRSRTGKPIEALRSYETARSIYQKLADANPAATEFKSRLADSYNNIGNSQLNTGRQAEALVSYELARAIHRKLADANPAVIEFQNRLATSLFNIGILLAETGKPTEALTSYKSATAIYQKLVDANPGMPLYQSRFASTLSNMAILHGSQRRWSEAHSELLQAIRLQRAALRTNPRNPAFRQALRNILGNLVQSSLALRKPVEAAEAARELATLVPGNPVDLYNSACCLAVCVTLASDTAEASRYADEAISLLKKAIATGWNQPDHTAKDPELAALRGRDDFRRLLAEMFDRVFPADPFVR